MPKKLLRPGDILDFVESKKVLTRKDRELIERSVTAFTNSMDAAGDAVGPITKEEHIRTFTALKNMFAQYLRRPTIH